MGSARVSGGESNDIRFFRRMKEVPAREWLTVAVTELNEFNVHMEPGFAARIRELVAGNPQLEFCMQAPSLASLAFKTAIDRPDPFRRSSDVGVHLGLTPRQYQSK